MNIYLNRVTITQELQNDVGRFMGTLTFEVLYNFLPAQNIKELWETCVQGLTIEEICPGMIITELKYIFPRKSFAIANVKFDQA